MFSGKTSELMRKVRRYQYAGKKCLVVNYKHDNRYDSADVIVNHDKYFFLTRNKLSARKIAKIAEITDFTNYDVIAIDEG
jgi:thymidine kinase